MCSDVKNSCPDPSMCMAALSFTIFGLIYLMFGLTITCGVKKITQKEPWDALSRCLEVLGFGVHDM